MAVFDAYEIGENVEVRYAVGDESYLTFSGDTEHPDPQEVVFADNAGRVHARRWTNRQGGYSAVRDTTTAVLIVAEAMHGAASADVQILTDTVANELNVIWSITPTTTILSQSSPRFEFEKRPPPVASSTVCYRRRC